MAEKDISPEKKLLNIIEGQEPEGEKVSAVKKGKKLFSLTSLKGRISFLKEKLSKSSLKMPSMSLNLATANTFLQICIAVLVMYLGISIKLEFSRLAKNDWSELVEKDAIVASEVEAVASLLKSENFYIGKAKARNLFEFADEELKKEVAFKDAVIEQRSELQKMVEGLKLVGISWSENPDAIIEDEKLKKTYFVKTGDNVNEIKVQAIYKDKIILHYGAEEVELK